MHVGSINSIVVGIESLYVYLKELGQVQHTQSQTVLLKAYICLLYSNINKQLIYDEHKRSIWKYVYLH